MNKQLENRNHCLFQTDSDNIDRILQRCTELGIPNKSRIIHPVEVATENGLPQGRYKWVAQVTTNVSEGQVLSGLAISAFEISHGADITKYNHRQIEDAAFGCTETEIIGGVLLIGPDGEISLGTSYGQSFDFYPYIFDDLRYMQLFEEAKCISNDQGILIIDPGYMDALRDGE